MDLCILLGTDYLLRFVDMDVNEIFEKFVLSGLNINEFLKKNTDKIINK